MADDRRRVGLIGFGSIAEHGHLPAWHSLDGVDVVAVADISHERLARAARILPDARLYATGIDLIRGTDIDTVDICTPPSTHVDLIEQAAEAGVGDIVCEKPLVLTEPEFDRVARARARNGCRVVSINNWSYSELNKHVLTVIESGGIGSVRRVELRIGRLDCALGNEGWMPRWRTDLVHAGGGVTLDHGWHQLYLLLGWIRNPIVSVSATMRTVDARHHPVEDEAAIDLQFLGAAARIELSWAADGRTNEGRIEGSTGMITTQDECIVVEADAGRFELPFSAPLSQSSYHPDWFRDVFARNVLDDDGGRAASNFGEAGALVSIIAAAYRSARRHGAPVRPAFFTDETEHRPAIVAS